MSALGQLVFIAVAIFVVDPKAWHTAISPSIVINEAQMRPLVEIGLMLPLSAAGIVLAWWLYSKPSSLPEKFSAALGPFARLSRNRFYWDDLYYLLFVHPAMVFGEWLVWFDDRMFGRGSRGLRNGAARFFGESAEPLSRGSAMIGALTTIGSVAVLAWMLLWLRS